MTDKILDYIKDNLSKKTALFLGFLVLLILFASLDGFIEKFIPDDSWRMTLICFAAAGWFLFWWYKRNHLPQNKKGCVGIIICVETENDKQKIRLKNDFAKRIRELIYAKNLKNKIQVILLNNYEAKCVIEVFDAYTKNNQVENIAKQWRKVLERTKGNFFIYGTIKERNDGENRYFLDLEAFVTHAPVQFPMQKQITQDFLSVWYKQISFQEKIEFKGFLFAADSVFIAVQYVVGIAALVSGDVFLACELHSSLDSDPYFSKFKQLPPNLVRVKRKIKTLLAEENFLIAKAFSREGNWKAADQYAKKSLSAEANYGAYLLESIIEFSQKRNADEALRFVCAARDIAQTDGTWRYNLGFLLMFFERFEEASKIYEEIEKYSFDGEKNILSEVVAFNLGYLLTNTDKIQSRYIIGYLKYKKEFNYPEGLVAFEKFIDESDGNAKYNPLRGNAIKYIDELKMLMEL